MRSKLAEAATTLLLVLVATFSGTTRVCAQPDFLAPIPAPAGSPCDDTAPDCSDICGAHSGSASACSLDTPIGDYLRCGLMMDKHQLLARHTAADVPQHSLIVYALCRTNCKAICKLCDTQPTTSSKPPASAAVPAVSPTSQLPLRYASAMLSPSPCSFSCVDIPPPSSPYTCAEQVISIASLLFTTIACHQIPSHLCVLAEKLWKVQLSFYHDARARAISGLLSGNA